ncbi:hypothetical protein SAMN05443633_10912 [Chryseobacterium arachidis]|uniref:Bacteriocin-type signal sequence-containing protein n=1 Tax=Chryseobacterium arachidis TaxID=1416778 RepID=A0A1M5G503_9FLAO|nr:hypothetical protein [Chryseobacterium arachidis]SHF98877.1 hypothetical protein SAMN05443633_10912 [Chryseobacterium arachidis]
MKNLKKLNRNELKTISGNGLFDNITGVVVGLGGVVGNTINGVGGVVANTVNGVGGAVAGTVVGLGGVVESTLCQVQCVVNGVVTVKLLSCGSTC